MEKLMKPSEYAKELGISRQAVYAKIKRGVLTAKDVEGKLYIVIENEKRRPSRPQPSTASAKTEKPSGKNIAQEYQKLLDAKDETISVLKGTVEDLKESNRQMSSTLRGEIDLLKGAFSEMKSLYAHRLEQMKLPLKEEVLPAEVKASRQAKILHEWVSIKKFFKHHGIHGGEKQKALKKRLKRAYKEGDPRLNSKEGKLKADLGRSFSDLL